MQLARQYNVLLIGDSCVDVWAYGSCNRLSPEAPVPVINPTHQTENGGMAKNVVSNLEALGCDVELVSNKNSISSNRSDLKDSEIELLLM